MEAVDAIAAGGLAAVVLGWTVPAMGAGADGGLLLGLVIGLCSGVDWALVVVLPRCGSLVHADPTPPI